MRLVMSNIQKAFDGVKVLKHAQINVKDAEVHALMGENGAGKSTLMKILTGVYDKDEGEICINGEAVHIKTIRDSENAKIAFIHQELNVLNEMSIVDNMFLGREITNRFGLLDKRKMKALTKEKLELLGLHVNPDRPIKSISIGKRQLVEIAKALLLDAELIIMDEPTAALTEKEIKLLFDVIRKLKAQGKSFIYISHRMEEIFEICDEITVMRDGQFIGQKTKDETSFEEIVKMMVGYDLENRFPTVDVEAGDVALKVENLSLNKKFYDVSFDVRKGEILGFSGLMGSGRTDVMHAIFGSVPADNGKIYVHGHEVRMKSPNTAKKLGIGFITEDRKNEGVIVDFDVKENMMLPSLNDYRRGSFIQKKIAIEKTEHYKKLLNIKMASPHIRVSNLSGGNQQKVVIAKWLQTNPSILILDEPTRGVDVGAKKEIYEIINRLKESGVAIIVVSSELPEVLGICDRIAVMREKKLVKILTREEATQEIVMDYATRG
ncbi:MAG: sugar ABC transporter ATP-binding protein [Lysinibacillus sp.]